MWAHGAIAAHGPIGTHADGAQGLLVHDTMAFSVEGTPLGLLDVQSWAREREDHGLRRLGDDTRALDDKESGKWLDSHGRASQLQAGLDGTRVVSVADREGDLFELLHASQRPEAADILVRAQHSRQLADGGGRLMEHLDAQPWSAELEHHIPHRGNQAARTARMAVRFDRVTLAPPKSKRALPAPAVVRNTLANRGLPPHLQKRLPARGPPARGPPAR